MRSIELVFDGPTDSLIRADWARLAAAGLPSLAAHTSPSNSPHITLAAGADLLADADLVADAGLVSGAGLGAAPEGPWQRLPLDVTFSGAIIFPAGAGKYVLARSVLPTGPLLDLHRLLHQGLSGALPLTCPGAWTPHITISRRIPGQHLGAAMDLLDLRLGGRCTAARLWDSTTKTVTPLGPSA
ncbi:2'-5' RNA ligase family protein [Pseudarthrobacter sp. BRE9]|uniref:2'-5' RNA ligase family protein n=1 Tax=Pseudarthrobacter sp. BRE9 TaxID=2962582 RepID=UPI002881BCA8|nr:2'-5' RNA ligase family protein [Pseudarthrobacter sp. BRE9]MDT0169084.1 2'-5' RNA ligase family protein [Pseudarthrobacter sp. BRE9]